MRLCGERGGTGRQCRPRAEQANRDAVGAVAPVDEEAEHLPLAERSKIPRRLRHLMSVTLHCSRSLRRCSNSSGNAMSRPGHADRHAVVGDRHRDGLVAAHVRRGKDEATRTFVAQALDRLDVDVTRQLVDLGSAPGREPHQFDEVAAVFRVRLERQPAHAGRPAAARGRARSWFDQRRFVGHSRYEAWVTRLATKRLGPGGRMPSRRSAAL